MLAFFARVSLTGSITNQIIDVANQDVVHLYFYVSILCYNVTYWLNKEPNHICSQSP